MKLLYEKQSPFKMIRVVEHEGSNLLLLEDRDEIHSEYKPDQLLLLPVTEHYWNYLTFLSLLCPTDSKVLIIGMGAGTCARQIIHYRPDLKLTGIELDKEIISVGEKFFGLDTGKVDVQVMDAITFLQQTQEKYDYIIVDAFIHGNLGKQFTTREFYTLVKQKLNDKGIVGINYLAEKNWEIHLRQGLTDVFDSKRQVGIPLTYNFVILASDVEHDLSLIEEHDDDIKRLKNFINRNIRQL
jgi:spermidine synthase